MRYRSAASHLQPYIMLARRRTTINHAFASAIAPYDAYDDAVVRGAVQALGQDPDADLMCVYCGESAETWDHVIGTVKDSRFSGFGSRIGNLVPCCKPCNSRKGNKNWEAYLKTCPGSPALHLQRHALIAAHIERYSSPRAGLGNTADHALLEEIRERVLALLAEGDQIAARLRATETVTTIEIHPEE